MKKANNHYITQSYLDKKVSKIYGKAKWIIFAEKLLKQGYKIRLYEAKWTFSKYLTVEKDDKKFKVRFSNHKPAREKELNNDCDFFVGVTNLQVTTTEDALKAVYNYFNDRKETIMGEEINLTELTAQMDELKKQKAALEFDLKNVNAEIEKIELVLQNLLKKHEVDTMDYGVYTFGWEVSTARRFSQKAFGQVYPDLLEKFKLPSETRKFVFKINK